MEDNNGIYWITYTYMGGVYIMAPEKLTFETIMAVVGCITTVLLSIKGIIVIVKEALNALPGVINGWRLTIKTWRNGDREKGN